MNTRALATHILAAKGLDGGDRVLAKSVAERLIHALRMQAKRGKIAIAGKERGRSYGSQSIDVQLRTSGVQNSTYKIIKRSYHYNYFDFGPSRGIRMPKEVDKFTVTNMELVELILKSARIREGRWFLISNFGFSPGHFGPNLSQLSPGVAVIIQNVGIQRETPGMKIPSEIVVDATKLTVEPSESNKASTKPTRVKTPA
jgi:hypothetical protein